jgi:hypothetical protein
MNKTKTAMEIGQSMFVNQTIQQEEQMLIRGFYRFTGMDDTGADMLFEAGDGSEHRISERYYYHKVVAKHIVPPLPRATSAVFFALYKSGKAVLTPPQEQIMKKLEHGWKIWIVKEAFANGGGQTYWKRPGQSWPEYAGKVYKAFWGLMDNVLRSNGFELHAPADFFHEEEWRGTGMSWLNIKNISFKEKEITITLKAVKQAGSKDYWLVANSGDMNDPAFFLVTGGSEKDIKEKIINQLLKY